MTQGRHYNSLFFKFGKSEQQRGQTTFFLSEAYFPWDEVKARTKCNAYLCYTKRRGEVITKRSIVRTAPRAASRNRNIYQEGSCWLSSPQPLEGISELLFQDPLHQSFTRVLSAQLHLPRARFPSYIRSHMAITGTKGWHTPKDDMVVKWGSTGWFLLKWRTQNISTS